MLMAILASMTSWLTPTSLFVLLHIVIGTIYLTSRLASPSSSSKNTESFYHPHPSLARTPSLLERVRSINFSMYKFPEPETGFIDIDHPVQLHRAPSLLERVLSINLYNHEFPEPETSSSLPELNHQAQVLHRTPSLLERVRSIRLPSFYGSETGHSDADLAPEPEHRDVHGLATDKMRKSASERAVTSMKDETEDEKEEESRTELRRQKSEPLLRKTTSFGDEAVDAKADDFINRFKNHLKLQRLDSILRSKAN